MTSRILAALIEENVIPSNIQTDTMSPLPFVMLKEEADGDAKMTDVEMTGGTNSLQII